MTGEGGVVGGTGITSMLRAVGRAASRAVVLNAIPTGRRDLSIEPTMQTNIDPKLDLYKVFPLRTQMWSPRNVFHNR